MFLDLVNAVRQNHALEHATIAILLNRLKVGARLMGRAGIDGFYIYGDVPTEMVRKTAEEGLQRLQQGEGELAVSPFCGTNLAVAGILAGVSSLVAMRKKRGLERFSQAIFAATMAVMAAQPLGRVVQQRLTTSAQVSQLVITGVKRSRGGRWTVNKVQVSRRR